MIFTTKKELAIFGQTFENKIAVGRYVDGIVTAIKDNPDVQSAATNLFSIDTSNMSVSEATRQIDEYTKTIADAIDEDQLELKIRPDFEEPDTAKKELAAVLRQAVDDHGQPNYRFR